MWWGTLFCTSRLTIGIDVPMPRPMTIMAPAAANTDESALSRESRNMPPAIAMLPVMIRGRNLPVRVATMPENVLAAIMPIIIGEVTKPESRAEVPMTPCTKVGM